MESSKQYMHPSLVLVNDEILSTQVRLMELYVKQAEAMAANEAARAQERFQTELTALQEELKQKEIALETQQTLSPSSRSKPKSRGSRAAGSAASDSVFVASSGRRSSILLDPTRMCCSSALLNRNQQSKSLCKHRDRSSSRERNLARGTVRSRRTTREEGIGATAPSGFSQRS